LTQFDEVTLFHLNKHQKAKRLDSPRHLKC